MKNRELKEKKPKQWSALQYNLLFISGMFLMLLLSFTGTKGTMDYFHTENDLFYVLVFSGIGWSLQLKHLKAHDLLTSCRKLAIEPLSLSSTDWTHITWLLLLLLVLIGIATVNLSFFGNGTFRMGAVVALAFVRIIRVLFAKKRHSRAGSERSND